MEFNGYVEGVSEFQAAPDSTHAPADLVGSHDRKGIEREEFIDNFTMMDAATGPFVPAIQTVEEKNQSSAIPTSSKAESSRRTESKKLASTGQANPLILDAMLETHIIQENSCHNVRVAATQVGIQQQVVHDFNSSM